MLRLKRSESSRGILYCFFSASSDERACGFRIVAFFLPNIYLPFKRNKYSRYSSQFITGHWQMLTNVINLLFCYDTGNKSRWRSIDKMSASQRSHSLLRLQSLKIRTVSFFSLCSVYLTTSCRNSLLFYLKLDNRFLHEVSKTVRLMLSKH